MTRTGFISIALISLFASILGGCSTAPKTYADKMALHSEVLATIVHFKQQDPTIEKHFDNAYGYAVFPSVGKGAAGVGGAYGRGAVYEKTKFVGYCDLSQGTVGVQLGGQEYSEVIFFQTKDALDRFRAGQLAFAAQASAVIASSGASADANYSNGVLVVSLPKGGAMGEAAIGGQKFTFVPDTLQQ